MIHYHDNLRGPQYDEAGHLTNNWNPAENYGDACARVFFRIDCPAYAFTGGFPAFETEEQREAFYSEARDVLRRFSIPEGTGHRSEGLPGLEHLHIHPQQIEGTVEKNKIRAVAEALNACAGFSVRWVDVYEDISPITNAEFLDALEARRPEIVADILAAFKTKRRNLFFPEYSADEILQRLAGRYTIPRRECESGIDWTAKNYLAKQLQELADAGQIVTAKTKSGTGYRTAKRDELAA